MSSKPSWQPQPTPAVPTGMHQVIPDRNPSIVGVREAFEQTFGGYVPADWTLDAECTRPGTDPEWFYPTRGGRSIKAQRALAICAQCTVRQTCLDDAIAFESGTIPTDQVRAEAYGVRGGMTEKDRRKLVAEQRQAKVQATKEASLADYAAGLTTLEISTRHHVAENAVVRWAQEAGIDRGSRGRAPRQAEGVA